MHVQEVRQLLDRDTVLLEYVLGEDHSYLWVVSSDTLTSYELPKRQEIEAEVRRIHEALTVRSHEIASKNPAQRKARIAISEQIYQDAAARLSLMVLSLMVLSPAASQIQDKRLLVVSDVP